MKRGKLPVVAQIEKREKDGPYNIEGDIGLICW